MEYSIEEHGFKIVRGFYSAEELIEIKKLSATWGTELVNSPKAPSVYAPNNFASFRYQAQPELIALPAFDKLTAYMGDGLKIINVLYTELHGGKKNQTGFDWHSDARTFLFIDTEKYKSRIVWFPLENTLDDGQGNLELILKSDVEKVFDIKLPPDELVQIYTTEDFKNRFNVELRHKGKYVIFNTISSRVWGFSDQEFSHLAIRPEVKPGDLIVTDAVIVHRTAPNNATAGLRSACVVRYTEAHAEYNGVLERGIPFSNFNAMENSEFWRRMAVSKKGDSIFDKSDYTIKEHGFTILKNFFDERNLKNIKQRALENIAKKEAHAQPFTSYSVFEFNAITEADLDIHEIERLTRIVNNYACTPVRLFNSAYIEVHASSPRASVGGPWHKDFVSFAIMDKEVPAFFSWFALDNTFDDNQGYVEFLLTADIEKVFGVKFVGNMTISSTENLKKRWNVDLTAKGQYVLYDIMDMRVIAFSDIDCSTLAIRPKLNPGDLIICDRSVIHQTAPTNSKTGLRSACTIRYADVNAAYNGALDGGIPFTQMSAYDDSALWQKLINKKRGYKLFE